MSESTTLIDEPVELRPEQGQKVSTIFLAFMVVGVVASLLGLAMNEESRKQFFFSYLTAYVYVMQIALGAMFWVMLHHLLDAGWSVVVRRVAENIASLLYFAGPLFLPVLVGMGTVYSWTHDHPGDHLLEGKRPFLNVPFFIIRALIYFVVWAWLAYRFTTLSRIQDKTKDVELTRRMQRLAAPGLILLGLTTAFAGIDWLMTLDYTWFSTMFGVYFWAGCFISSISAIALVVCWLRCEGMLVKSITTEHLHDLGKLMFAFVTFWAYITFSQYFLTWYADIPEEITYYSNRRWIGGHGAEGRHLGSWHWVGVIIVFCHVIIPFLALLSQQAKRNPRILGSVAAWLLVVHYVEIHWQVAPTLHREHWVLSWLDVTTLMALVGAAGFVSMKTFKSRPLLPVGDPRLRESLAFQNMCP